MKGRIGDAVLWVSATVGLAAVVGTAIAVLGFGARPVVVRSGSMEPAYRTGSLVVVRRTPTPAVGVGDVLLVERPDGGRVLHRVAAVEASGTGVIVQTKGDANPAPDPQPVVLSSTALRAWLHIPSAGRIAHRLVDPLVLVAFVCIAAGVAGVAGLPRRRPARA